MKVQISGEGAYIVSASRREFRGSKPHWPNDLPLGVVRQDGSIYVEVAPYGTQTRGNKPPPGWHDEAARLLNSPAARSAILAGLKKYRRETKKTGLHVARLSDGRRNAFSTSTQAVAWGLQKLKRMPARSAMGLFHGGPGAGIYRDAPHAVYAVTEYGHIEHSPLTNWAKAVAKHESGGNPKVKAKGGRILAFHVYAPDGFESGHATFEGARRAAKRASERSGVEMKVYRTSASGFTGVGHGTEVATFVGLGRGARHESGGNPRTTRQPGRSQEEHFTHAHAKSAGADETMLNLLYGPNPITDDELRKLIAKRPHVYGKYAAYLGKRGQGAKHESGGNPRTTRSPLKHAHERGFESAIRLSHEQGFKDAILLQEKVREKYNRLVRESEANYGSHGPLVSGVVREHFPADVKMRLRALVNDMNALGGAALTHHRGTGRRRHYSTLKDQVLKDRVNALVGKKS